MVSFIHCRYIHCPASYKDISISAATPSIPWITSRLHYHCVATLRWVIFFSQPSPCASQLIYKTAPKATCNTANHRPQHICVEYPSIAAKILLAKEELSCRKVYPQHTPRLFASQSLVIMLSKPLHHRKISIYSTLLKHGALRWSHISKAKAPTKTLVKKTGFCRKMALECCQ